VRQLEKALSVLATLTLVLATLTPCGQEADLAQALIADGVAASKGGLLAKTGWEGGLGQDAWDVYVLPRSDLLAIYSSEPSRGTTFTISLPATGN
jgi:hypothetical protein